MRQGVGEASAVSHGSTGLVGYIVPLTGESCSGVRSGWTSEPSWCGSCTAPDTCGGGGTPSACGGAPICVPATCSSLGFNCGPAGDGCGNLLQCGATCPSGEGCGAGGKPNVCGAPVSTCIGLCTQQETCAGTATTSLSGTVYAPNGTDPIYNALVYVPNAPVVAFTPGVSCECAVSGDPLVSATTGINGQFSLTNVPVGANIPLVIQLGRWRRQVTIPNVPACVNTAVAAALTKLPNCETGNAACPAGDALGDIPLIAMDTGAVDALECVFRKIGIDDSEFTNPGGTGRIQFFTGDGPAGGTKGAGAKINATTPSETSLWGTQAEINAYDMVLFACQGEPVAQAAASQGIVIDYANAGGRVFATHYNYTWLYNDAPFSGTADWAVDPNDNNTFAKDPATGIINQGFPEGLALAQWLVLVGASTTQGQITVNTLRDDFKGAVAPSLVWITDDDARLGTVPLHYTFDTPVGSAAGSQCGRVLFEDYHVENALNDPTGGKTFPAECTTTMFTPQEKLLEFEIFDLSSCIAPVTFTCTAKTCAEQGFGCGAQGDGCGNEIQCGTCTAPETCGGGGTPNQCGGNVCAALTCASQGFSCGPAGDGCGNELQCGTCPAGQACGAGGSRVSARRTPGRARRPRAPRKG